MRIELSPTTRHEGHSKLILEVEGEIVKRAYYINTTPVRGFESMLRGKPIEFAPIAVMRICGICQATHGIASCEAIENALNCEVPKDGLLLRELIGLGNRMHSHPLHHLLTLDDFIKEGEEELKIELIKIIQKMRKIGQMIVDIVGGEGIHPPNLVVGGVRNNITERAKAKIYYGLREYEKLAYELYEKYVPLVERFLEESGIPNLGMHNCPFLATSPTYGDREKIDWDQFIEIPPQRYYGNEIGLETSVMIPLYNGSPVEVGPRARMITFGKFKPKSALDINIARAKENFGAVYRAYEILDEVNINGKTRAEIEYKEGFGIGIHEAPRGTNVHMAETTKDGKIKRYSITAASTWNFPVVEKAIEGYPHQYAEVIMRAYDI
ncbi:coenzyme F420 hydrogenase subunit alpha [Methanocaldococcus villosus KIN24-T80]|uniref:Coenzyme F420 hydrogenase subunit alpha n=2 Tax=Methanocaldococcus villosus TaxID=667126 RepID=N6VQI7_9EURY|nr:coenzyme F420 hydrogenase subunit alpha [Methanocaldococcus villosus KIN24-T80]